MTSALLLLVLGGDPRPSLEERALSAYQRRDYAAACRLYRAATKAHPENAGLWADLGLCLHHLPAAKAGEAADAERRAIAAANGDAGREVRLSAYYNLDLIQGALELPTPGGHITEKRCETRTDRKCPGSSIQVCAEDRYEGGNGTGETVSYLSFRAGASDSEGPTFDLETGVSDFFVTSRSCEIRDVARCEQWLSSLSSENRRALDGWVGACVKAGENDTYPPDEKDCTLNICRGDFAVPDGGAPYAAVLALLGQKEDECLEDLRRSTQRTLEEMQARGADCRVVHVDVCNRRVGLVCDRDGKKVAEEHDVP